MVASRDVDFRDDWFRPAEWGWLVETVGQDGAARDVVADPRVAGLPACRWTARPVDPAVPHATVEVGRGLAINKGNFESVKVSVSVRMPCRVEEVEEVKFALARMVEADVWAQRAKILANIDHIVVAVRAGLLRLEEFDSVTRDQVVRRINGVTA